MGAQLSFEFTGTTPVARRGRLVDPIWSQAIREQWSDRFRKHCDRPFRVRFNDNASTVLSVRERHGLLELRLHHMFIEADDGVLAALAAYMRPGPQRRPGRQLDRFIERHRGLLRRLRPQGLRSKGAHYDLIRIRDALAKAYFGGPVEVTVAWASRTRVKGRRSVRLGSYSFEEGLIRIHPALDRPDVPPCVVVGVVYHEMLHHVLGFEHRRGRRLVHTAEFRKRERAYVHFDRAEDWERKHLRRVLGRRRAGADRLDVQSGQR
ncbi:MAG: hypothetical protein JXR96_24490 [Deltaproteobacteria bacterium]|nr:hypothetical protein [Deltaproteobacteria bacterium]